MCACCKCMMFDVLCMKCVCDLCLWQEEDILVSYAKENSVLFLHDGSGVTVWEILTFGAQPYADKTTEEVVTGVKHGTRLTQPLTCSLDLYKNMLSCECLYACGDGSSVTHIYMYLMCIITHLLSLLYSSHVSHNLPGLPFCHPLSLTP